MTPTETPEVNRDLFAKIHDQITRHPETHDQEVFEWNDECGTTRCVAGWALAFSARDGESIFATARRIMRGRDVDIDDMFDVDTSTDDQFPMSLGTVGWAAAQLLGLTGAEGFKLFYGTGDDEEAAELVELYARTGRDWRDEQ